MHLGMPALSWQHPHRRSFSIICDILPFQIIKDAAVAQANMLEGTSHDIGVSGSWCGGGGEHGGYA